MAKTKSVQRRPARRMTGTVKAILTDDVAVTFLLFITTYLVFNIGSRYVAGGDTPPNELLPISIVTEGNLDLNEFMQHKGIVGEGPGLPHFLAAVNRRIVATTPIFPAFLNVPVFALARLARVDLLWERWRLTMITTTLVAALTVVFMYLGLRRLCRRRRTALVFSLVFAFATAVWSVTCRGIWQHGTSLLLFAIAVYLLTLEQDSAAAWAGLFLGMAIWNRPSNAVIAVVLTAYVVVRHRRALLAHAALFLVPILLMVWYSWVYWGNPLALGRAPGAALFGGYTLKNLSGLLFSPARGLFVFSPVLVVGFGYMLYVLFAPRQRLFERFLAGAGIALLALYSRWGMWWAGHCFGYRFLIEMVPMLVIFLALAWERFMRQRWYLRTVFGLLLGLSVYCHFLGAYYYPSGFNTTPDNIDYGTNRLWTIRDTELVRCSRTFGSDLAALGGRVFGGRASRADLGSFEWAEGKELR
jgi:hypothetical protein